MKKISQIKDFVRYDMWRRTSTEYSGFFQRLGYAIIRTIALVIRGFTSKNLNDTAKSLTYSLIFAVIPILAMVVAVAKGFGVLDIIEQQLNHSFLGETNMVPTIMAMVQRYLDTTQGGLFIGIGLVVLLWAVYSFFQSVEHAFNRIWNVKRSRSILHQVTTYIAIVVLIPMLLVCSAGITIFIHSTVENVIPLEKVYESFHSVGVQIFQFVVCWILYIWMYMAIPNTKVRFTSALIPGILMGTLFQLLQMLSVYLIAMLGRTSIVYGAFATIPILMVLLQYTSLLILIGAEMSYAIQNNEEFEYEHDLSQMSRRYKDFITLYLLSIIIKRFEADEAPLTAHQLSIRDHLEDEEDRTYQPALDTHKISVGMVIERIESQGTELFLQQPSPEMETFWESYLEMLQNHRELNKVPVSSL